MPHMTHRMPGMGCGILGVEKPKGGGPLMSTLAERRRLRREAPMAYRIHRQERPSLLRAYAWRALQGAARTFPTLDEVGLTCLELPLRHLRRDLDGLTVL